MQPIRLTVIETDDGVRNRICQIIKSCAMSMKLTGAFVSLSACEAHLEQHTVDILLLDDTILQTNNLINVVSRLTRLYPDMAIVILSDKLNKFYVRHLHTAGISGYVYKRDYLEGVLIVGLQLVHQSHFYVSPKVGALTYLMPNDNEAQLNDTDRQVLWLMSQGESVQEIAIMLGLSTRSIYRIRNKLRSTLNARTSEVIRLYRK